MFYNSAGNLMYNLKIIEYPNGSVQIRLYDGYIGYDCMESEQQFEIDPFNGYKTHMVKYLKDNSGENQRRSLSRTKGMIGTYARCALWSWFVTLTFDGTLTDRTNFKKCMQRARNWLQNCRKRHAPDLKYLVVPELHADWRSWHIHALMSNTGSMPFSDSGHKISGQSVYNLSGWKWGFSTATQVRDVFRIQNYIVKYITKDCHMLATGAHRYYVSNNLPKPKESTMRIESGEEDDVISKIVDSFGLKIAYRSEPIGDYIAVTYIELQ